ncbi:hypothetical protein C0708_22520 [Aeromonas caviae]|nr:hypothetical protein C0708_22520 [Aeromonas caviae]
MTDQAATRPDADDTAKVDNVRPDAERELQGAGRRHLQQGRDGDDNSVTAKVTLSAGTR